MRLYFWASAGLGLWSMCVCRCACREETKCGSSDGGTIPVVAADRSRKFSDVGSMLHASELETWLPWLMHEVLEKISHRLIYSYVVGNQPSPKKVYRQVRACVTYDWSIDMAKR